MCDQREGNPCLGLVIGAFIAGLVYGALAWVAWALWNRFTPWPLTYWQMLVLVLVAFTSAGIAIVLIAMRQKEKKERKSP